MMRTIGNAPYVVAKHTVGSNEISNVKIIGNENDGYYIAFNSEDDENNTLTLDEIVDKIVKELKDNGNVLKDYISKDETKQKEVLKKLIMADIYTKYPKFNDDDKTLQGCIKIVRNDDNKTEFKYKPYDEFKKLISEKNSEIVNYYSLNDSGNLVFATKNEIDGDVQVSENTTQIDLKKIDNKYTMSFDYLWALLVTTRDVEFVENIAKLVLESDIEITIFEEKTTTTTYTRTTYTETHEKVVKFQNKTGAVTNMDYHKAGATDVIKEEKNEKTTTQITNKAEITKANTWFAEYKQNFKAKTTTSGSKEYPADNQLQNIEGGNEGVATNGITNTEAGSGWYENQYNEWKKNHGEGEINFFENISKNNYKSGTNTYIEQIKYEEEAKEIKEKTDKKSDTENFVTYLIKSKKALEELKKMDDMLYEMIEKNERADYMIDVTKYLMYKATGKDYGVTEMEFDEYDQNKFESVSGIMGGSLQEKVWWTLKDVGFSDLQIAAAMGNIQHESGFKAEQIEYGYDENSGGIGLCQWTNVDRGPEGNNKYLKNYASSKGTTWKDENTQLEFLVTYLTGNGQASNFVPKSNMGRTYFQTYYESTAWENYKETGNTDTDIEYLTKAFLANYEGPGIECANDSINDRIKYAKNYYNEFKGKSRPSGGQSYPENGDGYTQIFTSSSGKKYKEYKQFMGSYANKQYWQYGTISSQGCSITSIAITISGYNSNITPYNLKDSNVLISHYQNNHVSCTEKNYGNIDEIREHLKSGKPVVIAISGTLSAGGSSKYYGGHYIALLDIKSSGQVYVSDPGSTETNGWADLDDIVAIINGQVFYAN